MIGTNLLEATSILLGGDVSAIEAQLEKERAVKLKQNPTHPLHSVCLCGWCDNCGTMLNRPELHTVLASKYYDPVMCARCCGGE